MADVITCPSGLQGRVRGMKVREERVLADRKLATAGIPSDDFAAFGRILGQIAGVLVEVFVGALTFVIDVLTSAINTFRSAMAPLQPVFDAVKNAVTLVFQELGKLGAMFGFTSSASGQAGGSLGGREG